MPAIWIAPSLEDQAIAAGYSVVDAVAVITTHLGELVRQHAHYVTRAGGGRGAVREACELIMHAQGTLDARLRAYLE